MRYLRLIGAFGIVAVASLGEYGCNPSGDVTPPPPSTGIMSASGGAVGTSRGGTSSVATATSGGAPADGGAIGTGGMTSCSDPLLTLCNGACVDTETDRNNCGACSNPCGTTEVCMGGDCSCPLSNADGDAGPITNYQSCVVRQCVDLQSSTTNCGVCDNVCTPKRCLAGACGCATTDIVCKGNVTCTPGDATCATNGACFDPLITKEHCGNCATACGQHEHCVAGSCVLSCEADGLKNCGGACVDVMNNSAGGIIQDCGDCGIACPPSGKFECKSGTCICRTELGPTAAHCKDPVTGEDLCVDSAKDPRFCGSCDVACTSGKVCENSVCVCSSTATMCSDGCFDTTSDSKHCGGCDKVCSVGSHCSASACVCTAPLESCSNRCADYLTESANCGGCGNACGKGQACTAGACQCGAGLDLCSGSCFDFQTDATHCGDCTTTCSASQTCVAGLCACGDGLRACGQNCVDDQNDAQNCGGCGKTCTATQMCQGGTCKTSILKVQSKASADSGNMTQLYLNIAVCNTSSSSLNLSGYTLKYWYTEDGASTAQNVAVDCTCGITGTVTAALLDPSAFRDNATSVLQIKFGATTLAANSCTNAGGNPTQIRVYDQGYTCCYFPQAGDYSFSSSTSLKDNPNITVYNPQGLLVWGLEPALTP